MISRTHFRILVVLNLLAWIAGLCSLPYLPARLAIHWNLHGNPDGYGSKYLSALLIPALTTLVTALLLVLPLLGPFRSNFERFKRTYGRIAIVLIAGLVAIHFIVLLKNFGVPLRIERIIPIITGSMIAFAGNSLGKIRRNFYIGIRTPWTLANDAVWEQTNRAGARLMAIWGLIIVASAIILPPLITLAVILGGALLLVMWSLIYSMRAYHRLGEADQLGS